MEHYLKTLSNPPIVYRESTSTLASRNSHSINWNNEVGHQFNVNKYINDMINIEFNLSTASKHKEPSDNFNFLDVLFLSKGSFPSSPFRQLYLESSGFLWEDKFYYKIGFDDFYQVKGEEMSCQYINAYTIPTLFTYTMGESSFTTYFEMQNKKDKIFTIDDSDNYTLSNEQQYTGRYLSFTSTYKGKLSFTYFKEDAWQPGYSYWEGYDITSNINSTTQLSLFYGSQKGGLVCANGVCAVQPGLNDAVKITFRSLF